MKFQKVYIVLAALVLALGTAVYVNWQFGGGKTDTSAKELGAASYVNATVSTATEDENVQTAALSEKQESYFASERTKRQSLQDEVIDKANEVLKLEDISDDDMTEAQNDVKKIIRNFTVQDSIESIVKAKGFSDCLCYISDDGVTVVVPETELDDTSALVIDDAVTSHYEVSYDDISIVGA